jgi:hypothetical protein
MLLEALVAPYDLAEAPPAVVAIVGLRQATQVSERRLLRRRFYEGSLVDGCQATPKEPLRLSLDGGTCRLAE